MARILDSSDVTNVRRRNRTYSVQIEYNPDGTLNFAVCHRVQDVREGGVVIGTKQLPSLTLSAAEFDAVALQIRNRIEQIDAVADTKELALETP